MLLTSVSLSEIQSDQIMRNNENTAKAYRRIIEESVKIASFAIPRICLNEKETKIERQFQDASCAMNSTISVGTRREIQIYSLKLLAVRDSVYLFFLS